MLASVVVVCSHIIWPILPQLVWLVPLFTLLIILRSFRYRYVISASLIAILTFTTYSHWYSRWHLSAINDHQNYISEGTVVSASTDSVKARYVEFVLRADAIGVHQFYYAQPKLLMRWYEPLFKPKQGNRIKVYGNIRPISHFANPNHDFNAQKYLTANGINRIVVIRNSPTNCLLSEKVSFRQRLIDNINSYSLVNTRWLLALGIGFRQQLDKADWTLLQVTSTAHLFSISGLHLALVAGYLFMTSRVLSSVFSQFIFSHRTIVLLSNSLVLVGCLGYTILAGAQIPVIRAFTAVCLVVVYSLLNAPINTLQIFIRVLFFICILFPLSALNSSFWLSFGAVSLIFITFATDLYISNKGRNRKLLSAMRLQWMFFIVGVPLSLILWDQITLVSLLANAVLIPVISLLILPLLLIGFLIEIAGLSGFEVLLLSDFLIHICVFWLSKLASIQTSLNGSDIHLISIVIALTIAVLLWHRSTFTSLSLFILCCLWAYSFQPKPSSQELVFFDVGHGNAAVFRSNNTRILIDFARGNTNSSLFAREILPYLNSNNIDKFDIALLSHFDNDHAGGLPYLLDKQLIRSLWSPRTKCVEGRTVEFSGFSLQVLWPKKTSKATDNQDSCVVLLTVNKTRIMFAGDIGIQEENAIIRSWPDLEVDILVAPHHGSKTSSGLSFVNSLSPEIVVFSTSFPNHWGHPHQDVVNRYEQIGATIYHLGQTGALIINWEGDEIKLSTVREDLYNRWHFKK